MAQQPAACAPDAGEGAVIPSHLVKLAAFLVEYAAKELGSRNGGPPRMPDLPELRKILDAAVAAASGRPSVTMEAPSRALLTTSQAAALMDISARRVRHHAAAGRIRAERHGRDWLIDPDSARDYRGRERTAA